MSNNYDDSEVSRYLASFLKNHEDTLILIIDDVRDAEIDREKLEALIKEFYEELP